MYLYYFQVLALLLFLVNSTLESPIAPTVTSAGSDGGQSSASFPSSSNGFIKSNNAEISYFWHQKGKDLLPLWPLESPGASSTLKDGNRERVILIHQISDDPEEGARNRLKDPNGISTGFTRGRDNDANKISDESSNNIFVFCLMFLFGLIICGLIWCLCTVSRHQVDNNGDHYRPSMNSRFSRRRADVEVILPYSTDLPPSYDDIVADFEKLGAQCILPSYKDIMTKKASSGDHHQSPAVFPPPRYTSPPGSFSAQGRADSPNSPSGVRRSS